MSAVSLIEGREECYIKAINNNYKVQCVTDGRRVCRIKGQPVEGGSRVVGLKRDDLRTFCSDRAFV